MDNGNNQEFIGTKEASRMADYHPTYLTLLMKNGVIPAYKVGGRWKINKSELLAHIAKGSNQGANKTKVEENK